MTKRENNPTMTGQGQGEGDELESGPMPATIPGRASDATSPYHEPVVLPNPEDVEAEIGRLEGRLRWLRRVRKFLAGP